MQLRKFNFFPVIIKSDRFLPSIYARPFLYNNHEHRSIPIQTTRTTCAHSCLFGQFEPVYDIRRMHLIATIYNNLCYRICRSPLSAKRRRSGNEFDRFQYMLDSSIRCVPLQGVWWCLTHSLNGCLTIPPSAHEYCLFIYFLLDKIEINL